ncbi:MAG: DUF423 domain-containing protein [Flavobacteriales bacterium]|nr:DUF423 domain-containing protein [Flavobacteriales bacterium]
MGRNLILLAGLILVLAVILGAFGAHALKGRIAPEALSQWKTGVEYQFYHGLGLLLLAALRPRMRQGVLKRIGWCFALGVVCFSGSLYLLSTRELSGLSGIGALVGPMTPLGGLFFILGWMQLIIAGWRSHDKG